uniref:Asialoglycoprotein receptor 1-like n=1 Tax=Hippocampus comes TaxID=109280 RepID=A0A3Q2Y2H3_HIPCM
AKELITMTTEYHDDVDEDSSSFWNKSTTCVCVCVWSLSCFMEYVNGERSGCCPLGWERFSSSCYQFSQSLLSWNDARDWCNGHDSHLAIIMSDEEWDFVRRHSQGRFFWIGLSDERTGSWEWINQTPYVMNRRHWRPGQPDSWIHHGLGPGDEDCAHVHADGRLNDLHCSTRWRTETKTHLAKRCNAPPKI